MKWKGVHRTPIGEQLLDKQPELKWQRLVLLTVQDSHVDINGTIHRIFTGLSHGNC
jgi:hypothetical protein